jgi:hypothetical protein
MVSPVVAESGLVPEQLRQRRGALLAEAILQQPAGVGDVPEFLGAQVRERQPSQPWVTLIAG